VEIKNSNGDYNRYTYNGDNIVKIISYEKDTDRDRTTLFEYKNGKISKQTYSSLDSGEPQSATYVNTTTYEWITNDHVKTTSKGSTGNYTLWQEYFFSNGNLTKNIYKTDHVSVPSKTYTTTYTYDKTNNPFKNVIGLEAILDTYRLGTNNVLQRDIVAESGSYYKHIYSYELDATRYPSKKTDTYYDNGVESSKPKDVILYKYRE
jgi:hypothetical protein